MTIRTIEAVRMSQRSQLSALESVYSNKENGIAGSAETQVQAL